MSSGALKTATFPALAVIAFIVACVSHEAAGHGLACLGSGGHITLLTSVYAQCRPSIPWVDLAGPLMNLVVAAAAARALHHVPASSPRAVFLGLLLAYSGFWGAGYCIFSAITNSGDLAFVLRDLSLEPRWLWRLGLGLVGLFLYRVVRRQSAAVLPNGSLLFAAYCTVGAVSCAAVLFYPGPELAALRESAQESLLAPVGLLFTAFGRRPTTQYRVPADPGIVTLGVVVTVAFWLILGRGIHA